MSIWVLTHGYPHHGHVADTPRQGPTEPGSVAPTRCIGRLGAQVRHVILGIVNSHFIG
jgi:hypothetical protein